MNKKLSIRLTMSFIMVSIIFVSYYFINTSKEVSKAAANGFYVNGTSLYDANGNQFVMRGINMAHTWFKNNTSESIQGIAATGANTVRVVLSNGELYTRDSAESVRNIINQCKENNLIAVLEVHDGTGSDSIADLNKIVDYWIDIKAELIGNEKYVILNIANEWYGTWNSSGWRDGYVTAIPRLREAGIQNTIMVDCAGWGQYPKSIADYGTEVFNSDPQGNTMFSIHMYEYAGGDANTVKSNIDNVLNKNLCVIIGEFASYHTNGDVDEHTIMNDCQQKKVGYLGWSWKGNNSDLSYLDISGLFGGGNYTEWGDILLNHADGIRTTSQICTVYTGNSGNSGQDNEEDNQNQSDYIQYFYGSKVTAPWGQGVSIMTNRSGGAVNLSDISQNGYFYIEYTGAYQAVELCLQSWSGGQEWVKVSPSESGTDGVTHYAKFNRNDFSNAFGDLSLLDQVHIGATHSEITVLKLQYVFSK